MMIGYNVSRITKQNIKSKGNLTGFCFESRKYGCIYF